MRRYLDHCRSQQAITNSVSAGKLFRYCIRFILIGGFSYNRFVDVRIEPLTDGGDRFNAERFEYLVQLLGNQFHAMQEMAKLFGLVRFQGALGIKGA